MASPQLFDLLTQLPGSLGDVQGMHVKAAHLDGIAARLRALDQWLAQATLGTSSYRGPAADEFRAAMHARHQHVCRVIERLAAARQRLSRAASVMDNVSAEVNDIRRRIERDATSVGSEAQRLVDDAQRLAGQLRRL